MKTIRSLLKGYLGMDSDVLVEAASRMGGQDNKSLVLIEHPACPAG